LTGNAETHYSAEERMTLNERFLPRKNPQVPGEKGTPFALSNGLGRFFVARERMTTQGQLTTEYAKDEKRRLEQAATLAVRRHSWGADDDSQWYHVTYTVANLAFTDTKGQYVKPQRPKEGNKEMKRPSEYQGQKKE
jgi:hypothetical protein